METKLKTQSVKRVAGTQEDEGDNFPVCFGIGLLGFIIPKGGYFLQ